VKKILVVDDEANLREMLKDILSLADYEVVTAENGEEGLRKVYEETPDLVLLDCSMPVLDGYEVLERMRSDPLLVNKPVIMLTVLSGENDQIKGLNLGVADYITKPFKASLLLARVKAILERTAKSISANPLTLLAGNSVIKSEAEKRLASGKPFVMIYIDINSFKSFNDRYGFQRGDEEIKHTASIIIQAVRDYGQRGDFVGHIGGDDFIVIASEETYSAIANQIVVDFDNDIPDYYDPEDKSNGYILSTDRANVRKQFPIMAISLAVVNTAKTKIQHFAQLSEIAAELKKIAKQNAGSTIVIDRRKE
jgi:diguanylate cyclase (GGDEF)-like protein